MKYSILSTILMAIALINIKSQTVLTPCLKEMQVIMATVEGAMKSRVALKEKIPIPNDLGDYDKCKRTENYDYYLNKYTIVTTRTLEVQMGLCIPSSCTDQELAIVANQTEQKIMKMLAAQQQQQTLVLPSKSWLNADAAATKPVTVEFAKTDSDKKFNAWALVFFLLIILAIVGTTLDFYYQKPTEVSSQSTISETENTIGTQLLDEEHYQGEQVPISLKIINCFSLRRNCNSIFHEKKQSFLTNTEARLQFLHGFQFFFIIWIVLSHTYKTRIRNVAGNLEDTDYELKNQFFDAFVQGGIFAIAAFMFIFGFLLFQQTVKYYTKHNVTFEMSKTNISKFFSVYAEKLINIWPSLAITLLFFWKMMVYFGDGPLWDQTISESSHNCSTDGYKRLFFIENWLGVADYQSCLGWCWFITFLAQLFILVPILALLYVNIKKKLIVSIGCFIYLLFLLGSLLVAQLNHFDINIYGNSNPTNKFEKRFYVQPWAKGDAFVLGILAAMLYQHAKINLQQNRDYLNSYINFFSRIYVRIIFYIAGIFFMMLWIFFIYDIEKNDFYWKQGSQTFFNVCYRSGFNIGFFLLIIPDVITRRGVFVQLFQNTFFFAFSKLILGIYLVQGIAIDINAYTIRKFEFIENQNLFQRFCGDMLYSIIGGFLLLNLVELPGKNLLNLSKKKNKMSFVKQQQQ